MARQIIYGHNFLSVLIYYLSDKTIVFAEAITQGVVNIGFTQILTVDGQVESS